MKKLVAILVLCLTCVFCIIGFTACDKKTDNANQNEQQQEQGQTVQTMTKDGFFAELEAKEKATFAAADLHYDTVGCKYVESSYREINQEGTYAIIYNTDNNGHPYAYVSINYATGSGIQQQVLGLSAYLKDFLSHMPEQMLSDADFKKDGDNLVFTLDADYPGSKTVAEYTFDKNGYLTYGAQNSTIEGAGSNGFTFTATAYNKAAEQGVKDEQAVSLTKEEFLTWLEETEGNTFNYDSKHYATVSGTAVHQGSGNTDGTYTGTFNLTYGLDTQEYGHAAMIIEIPEVGTLSLGLLGFYPQIYTMLNMAEAAGGDIEIYQVGANREIEFGFDYDGTYIIADYIFDSDGYILYRLEQQGDYKDEITITAYNKADGSVITLAGKTFVFEDILEDKDLGNGYMHVSDLVAIYQGVTFTFKTDGEFEMIMPTEGIRGYGTYTQNGAEFSITQVGVYINDEKQDGPEEARVTVPGTIDGEKIQYQDSFSATQKITYVYTLQK
ncbi:MAG: hypothetical protein IJQ23_05200 [Clostridia bacterium]|nr:hypothetical protein [Clostridia bacterium]